MAESQEGELLLVCRPCRRVVTVGYFGASFAQGLSSPNDHRTCGYCGEEMTEASRSKCGHVGPAGEECTCRS